MAKVSLIKNYKVTSSDCFFFDNNIWMFLFAPIADYKIPKQKAYSRFLREIQSAGATIFISSLILSEYINRCLRISHGQWEKRNHYKNTDYKKDYRNTEDFKNALESTKDNVYSIMSLCVKTPDNFHVIEVDDIFSNVNNCDFNDAYFVELCKKGNFKLVTDDKDFLSISEKIEIITM